MKDKNLIKSASSRSELKMLFNDLKVDTIFWSSFSPTPSQLCTKKLTKIFLKDRSFGRNTENEGNSEIYVNQRNLFTNFTVEKISFISRYITYHSETRNVWQTVVIWELCCGVREAG